MSTSSIETPTSPNGPLQHQYPHNKQYQQQYLHHQNQQQQPVNYHKHTTTAIVVSAGAGPASGCSNAIIGSSIVPNYKSHTKRVHTTTYANMNDLNAKSTNTNNNQSTHSLLTPSSSTSSSPSVSASASAASTSVAVHHQHQRNPHQQRSHSYSQHVGRSSTSYGGICAPATSTPNSIKRHTDVSDGSSSSSCCSSSASVSADAGAGLASASAVAAVTPAVVSSNGGAVIAQKLSRTIPSDKINLRLILVSGKTKEFLFNPSDSAGDIAQTVFDNWPEDWEREAVSKAEILRLIYQGRFLHCNVTLGALGLPLGKTTVMHLVPRDNLPEPNSQDQRQKSKGGSSRCCSTTCCIL